MAVLAHGAEGMPRSGIREIMDLAWSLDRPVVGLHVGEPSFSPPEHALQAARDAYTNGDTHYVPNAGVAPLRAALAEKIDRVNHFRVTDDQVVVTAGGTQALQLAMSLTVSAGDEVLVPDPGWPNYAMAAELLQARPVHYPLRAENGFQPDVADLDALITERTTAIVLNTPSNPLGTVCDADVVEQLVRLADRRDVWLLSDECYDGLTFDRTHVSAARFDEQSRVLSAFSFSKTYAMTGLRVGYLAAPPHVAAVAAKLQEPLVACVNAPAQAAALAALRGPQDDAQHMRETYQHRRDLAVALIDDVGMRCLVPQGAFYLWLYLGDRCRSVSEWALEFLRAEGVAVAPGTVFGTAGEGWARLSLAAGTDDLLDGIRRISAAT